MPTTNVAEEGGELRVRSERLLRQRAVETGDDRRPKRQGRVQDPHAGRQASSGHLRLGTPRPLGQRQVRGPAGQLLGQHSAAGAALSCPEHSRQASARRPRRGIAIEYFNHVITVAAVSPCQCYFIHGSLIQPLLNDLDLKIKALHFCLLSLE